MIISIAASGCSSSEHPPPLSDYGSTGGHAGSPGTGGSPSDADGAVAAAGDADGSAGRDGSSPIEDAAGDAERGSCGALDPDKVYLVGTLSESSDQDAILDFAAVSSPCHELATQDAEWARIRPDGRVNWLHRYDNAPYIYVPDSIVYEHGFWSVGEGFANDVPIPAPPCFADGSAIQGVGGMLTNPTDGSIVYTCLAAYVSGWYNERGDRVPGTLAALGYGGLRLTRTGLTFRGPPSVIDATNDEHLVTGLPGGDLSAVCAYRARQDGFWIVLRLEPVSPSELWHIDATGSAVRVSVYPPPPPEWTRVPGSCALDGQGNLYQMVLGYGEDDVVVKRPLEGGTSTVVYSDAGLPRLDLTVSPPVAPIRISSGSDLITGP